MRRQLVKQPVVEGEARVVGFALVAVGKDARPGDGNAQAAESHFGKQRDIFRVAVIEIDRHILNAAVAGHALHHRA